MQDISKKEKEKAVTVTRGDYTAIQQGRGVYISNKNGEVIVHVCLGDERPLNEAELASIINEVARRQ